MEWWLIVPQDRSRLNHKMLPVWSIQYNVCERGIHHPSKQYFLIIQITSRHSPHEVFLVVYQWHVFDQSFGHPVTIRHERRGHDHLLWRQFQRYQNIERSDAIPMHCHIFYCIRHRIHTLGLFVDSTKANTIGRNATTIWDEE